MGSVGEIIGKALGGAAEVYVPYAFAKEEQRVMDQRDASLRAFQKGERLAGQAHAEKLSGQKIAAQEGIAAADRESREKVAGINADARLKGGGASGWKVVENYIINPATKEKIEIPVDPGKIDALAVKLAVADFEAQDGYGDNRKPLEGYVSKYRELLTPNSSSGDTSKKPGIIDKMLDPAWNMGGTPTGNKAEAATTDTDGGTQVKGNNPKASGTPSLIDQAKTRSSVRDVRGKGGSKVKFDTKSLKTKEDWRQAYRDGKVTEAEAKAGIKKLLDDKVGR